jgi:mercuric ion transport protein
MTSDSADDDCCAGVGRAPRASSLAAVGRVSSPILSSVSALVVALFPKCPMCWAAYLSLFGVAGVDWLTNSPWLLPLLVLVLVVNVGSLWWIGKRSQRRAGFYLAALGALTIVIGSLWLERDWLGAAGIALTFAGSVLSVSPLRVSPLRVSPLRVSPLRVSPLRRAVSTARAPRDSRV